jgi:hypothetical protein
MSSSSYLTEVNRVTGGCCRPSDPAARRGQQRGEFLRVLRAAKQEALDALALEQAQSGQLVLGLDSFGVEQAAALEQRAADVLEGVLIWLGHVGR